MLAGALEEKKKISSEVKDEYNYKPNVDNRDYSYVTSKFVKEFKHSIYSVIEIFELLNYSDEDFIDYLPKIPDHSNYEYSLKDISFKNNKNDRLKMVILKEK